MRYAGIMSNDTVDVLHGITVSFWCQGCPYHCVGCHNLQTWDFNGGMRLDDDYIDKVIKLIGDNGIKRSLSILGGEPLCKENIDIVYNLVKKVRETYKDITIYVWSGNTYERLINSEKVIKLFRLIDILIDGRFILSKRDITLKLRGSANQRVIDVQKSLINGGVITIDVDR